MTKPSSLARRAAAALAAAALLAIPGSAAAQHISQQPPPARRSTLSGVYTADQAERGGEVYAMQCRSCHTPASHTGEVFAKFWKGKTLADLLTYVGTQMPKNDPGGLDANQYADVVAYLLKMNALPTGPVEIPTDTAGLSLVAIELAPPAPAEKSPARPTAGAAKKKPARDPTGPR